MDRSHISPALMRSRGADIARIPLAAMKTISGPGELGMRLNAYDALVAKARRPHLEPDLVRGYHDLAREVLTTEDRARAVELMKTAGIAPGYSGAELQSMLAAGTAIRLDGRIVPAASVRDVRYQVTVAQGALGRKTPEDSAAFRNFLQRRARALGVTLPHDWGRPAARSSAVAAGKAGTAPHDRFTGTHTHPHPDNGIRGNPLHEHAHTHDGDAGHAHMHGASGQRSASPPVPASKSAASAGRLRMPDGAVYRPAAAVSGALAKAAEPRPVTVPTPALDEVSNSRSLADGLSKLHRQGRLGQAAAELGAVAEAADGLRGVSKAAEYEAKARRMTSAADRSAYLELARAERAKSGTR